MISLVIKEITDMTIIGKPYQFHRKCKTDMEENEN
jgi:hypothetical protein